MEDKEKGRGIARGKRIEEERGGGMEKSQGGGTEEGGSKMMRNG